LSLSLSDEKKASMWWSRWLPEYAFPIKVPTLRERKDDIALLAEHFLARIENGERFLPVPPDVIEKLM